MEVGREVDITDTVSAGNSVFLELKQDVGHSILWEQRRSRHGGARSEAPAKRTHSSPEAGMVLSAITWNAANQCS